MKEQLQKAYQDYFGERGRTFFAPGRVNLLGEHIDYNGGSVLPMALTLGTYLVCGKREDNKVCLHSLNLSGEPTISELGDIERFRGNWQVYPQSVLKALEGRFISGVNLWYAGNLPTGAGLSSSASIEVVTVSALNTLFNLGLSEEQIAKVAQVSENRYVGVACGIMDQYASALCHRGKAMKLDCETGEWSHHKLPDGFCVVITDSGVKRKLTESRYNDRRMECQRALQLLNERGAAVKNLCSATEEQVKKLLFDYPIEQKRARHCVTEHKRMNDAIEALQSGDGFKFGVLMNQCHWSLSRDFEVSHPTLDALVTATEGLEGCLGCRLTGAGFGGCTVALIQKNAYDDYVERVERAAREGGHPKPISFITDAGAGACQLGELS